MKELNAGIQVQLKDDSIVTITEIKEEITFSKEENGQVVSQTVSGSDFRKLVKPNFVEPKEGLKFLDSDQAISEIKEVSGDMISYKKTYGADSWNSTITVKAFKERQESKLITILE